MKPCTNGRALAVTLYCAEWNKLLAVPTIITTGLVFGPARPPAPTTLCSGQMHD